MMHLFHEVSADCSRNITRKYSTSFSLGIKCLSKRLHHPIYSIYGFVRLADEIVDTFHDFPKRELLHQLKKDTYQAINQGISLNPVLHSFQQVVNNYHIDHALIDAFLHSMEMDLDQITYDQEVYSEYIYGSAEVVGLMCLKVFCENDEALYTKLCPSAKSLGAAFQKVNFLRDLKEDADLRGRMYFPGVDFNNFTKAAKEAIEADIENDFALAYNGIVQLPDSARMGVYLAYIYYVRLFQRIKKVSASKIRMTRLRIPNSRKLLLLFKTYFQFQFNTF